MARIPLNETVGSLLDFYKRERNIYGKCPHCGEPFRLSDVKLTYGKQPPKDLIQRLQKDRDRAAERLELAQEELEDVQLEFEEKLETLKQNHELRVQTIEERWKDRTDTEVQRKLQSKVREIRQQAVARSRATQLGKTIEKIAPMFPGFGHHPADVRPVFDPVDFVVFDGYYAGDVTDVVLVEFKTGGSRLTPLQASIRDAVQRKRVHFQERRLSAEALRALTQGRHPSSTRLIG